MHSGLRKHGRSLVLVALATSMMLYVMSRDVPDLNAAQLGSDFVTLKLTKDEVQDILKQEDVQGVQDILKQEDVQGVQENKLNQEDTKNIPEDMEVPNIMPKTRKNKQKRKNFVSLAERKKKNKEKRRKGKEVPKESLITTNMSKVIQADNPPKPTLNIAEKLTEERTNLLSKFENAGFVVINNKVYSNKDFNSSAVEAALALTIQKKALSIQKKAEGSPSRRKEAWPPVLEPSGASLLRQIDLSKYTPEDQSYLESRMEVYEERARHAGAACASFPDDQRNNPRALHLVWDTKHQPNIVFCPNYKVASTTMMTYFLRLAHFNDDNPKIAKLPQEKQDTAKVSIRFGARQYKVYELYKPPPTKQEKLSVFKQALRVIVVRHPFTRILSAYRDKMTKMKPKPEEFKFRKLQKDIIAKYRKPNSEEKSPYPTFAEFVQYVIDSTASMKTSRDWQTKVNCWTPYWTQCEVCSSDYNFIIKLETMDDDERFLITLADLTELKEIKDWKHKKAVTSTDAAPDFYKQITREQMQALYQRYKRDCDAFDYKIDNYLAIAKDAQL